MHYTQYSLLNQLVIKLSVCEGLSLPQKWRLVKIAEQLNVYEFSAAEVVSLVQVTNQQLFYESWHYWHTEHLTLLVKDEPLLPFYDQRYPESLREIALPPLVLFYRGEWRLLTTPLLAFVGARTATSYASEVLTRLLPPLLERGYTVVSGLARGVDYASHQLVMQLGGRTIGVIGSGLATCYPKSSLDLFIEMEKHQLIISEYRAQTPVRKHHFPMRNRIIAALAQGTCVIEAQKRSGSLITAQLALEYGKEVFAVPGSILSNCSLGCHELIQDGAKCVCTANDILEEFNELL